MSKTCCRICEAACGLEFVDGKLRPDRTHPVSRGFVCAKGLRFLDVAHDPARLLSPMIREGGALREAEWGDAVGAAGAQLRSIRERHGPHSVGVYIGNPLAFSAFGQVAALLFAKALGTRNVFTAGSQDCNNKFAGAQIMHGSPAIQPTPDFEHADLAVLFGTNPAVSQCSFVHLEGGATVFDRMRARGARTIFVDVRETESAKRWGGLAGDPIRSIPGAQRLHEAFSSLETLVCLDLFESRTGQLAHVLLPASSWLERADVALPGLPLQTVELLQTTAAVMPRRGRSRPDHEVLALLSNAIGRPLFGDLPGARAMTSLLGRKGLVDRLVPKLSGLAWRLFDRDPAREKHGVRVPAPRPGSYLGVGPLTPGHTVRFWHARLDGERARLAGCTPPGAVFVLLGRRRRIGHNSWLHGGVRAGGLASAAWLAEVDMQALGLGDGDLVTLETSQGSLSVPARAEPGVAPRTVVFPHGDPEVNINELPPSGPAHIEPLSGMLHMTGVPVNVRPASQLERREAARPAEGACS